MPDLTTSRSLHIGLNHVDSTQYHDRQGRPWSGTLRGCEYDAKDMRAIAAGAGLEPRRMLLSAHATSEAVFAEIDEAAATLHSGDLFFITYSGHGGLMATTNAHDEEPSGLDQTWVLFDRQVIDDELFGRWTRFDAGVRVFVLSDSCHSGTILRLPPESVLDGDAKRRVHPRPRSGPGLRVMPEDVQEVDDERRRDVYQEVREKSPDLATLDLRATVLLISGCQDDQSSRDGDRNGRFTEELRKVWGDGDFTGSYFDLYVAIRRGMPVSQRPNFWMIGNPAQSFREERPLTV